MNLEIAKYRNGNKEEFLKSSPAKWLSELANQSTLKTFSDKHNLPDIGRNLFIEIDYENMSGVSNPNLCNPNQCLIYLDALRELYKSDKLNYQKLFNSDTGEPIQDTRAFIQGKFVNLSLEYHNGYTIQEFYKLKNLNFDSEDLGIYEVQDKYDNDKYVTVQGNKLKIELQEMNAYKQKQIEIDKTIEFVKGAIIEGSQIQLIAV